MITIAITGGIGSGKSCVAGFLREAGVPVYDSDSRTKSLYDEVPGLVSRLEASLGTSLTGPDGRLDRAKLASVIFTDTEAMRKTEEVVLPAVREDFLRWRSRQDSATVALESATVLEKRLFDGLFDKVIIVDAPEDLRIRRVAERSSLSPEETARRIRSQHFDLSRADFVILNDSTLESLRERTEEAIRKISYNMDQRLKRIYDAAEYVAKAAGGRTPEVGIILGSGLGSLAEKIEDPLAVPYKDIPGFPASTAIGHKGNFIFGRLAGKDVVAMQGRIHYYEGYPMDSVVLPVRVMIKLGIKYLFVSNAAGATNYHYQVGDLMIIKDHINLLPNPLIGPNLDEFGPRFPDMTRPYDPALIRLAKKKASKLGIHLQEGVYVACTGPSYETPAEYKFFRTIGADVVGMSTVPEVIVARHSDIPVFGMSVVTDVAHDDYSDDYVTDGDAIVAAADAAADKMSLLFTNILKSL